MLPQGPSSQAVLDVPPRTNHCLHHHLPWGLPLRKPPTPATWSQVPRQVPGLLHHSLPADRPPGGLPTPDVMSLPRQQECRVHGLLDGRAQLAAPAGRVPCQGCCGRSCPGPQMPVPPHKPSDESAWGRFRLHTGRPCLQSTPRGAKRGWVPGGRGGGGVWLALDRPRPAVPPVDIVWPWARPLASLKPVSHCKTGTVNLTSSTSED